MEMICLRVRTEPQVPRIFRAGARLFGIVLVVLNVSACSDWLPHVDLAPTYEPPQYVVPASWHGASPFVEARPADGELRPDWWTLYNDPVLNKLIDQAMQDGAEDPQAHLRRRMAIEWFSTDSQCFLNDEPIFWVDRQSPAKTNLKQQSVRPAEQHSSWSEQVVQSRSGTARMTVRPVRNRLIRHLTLSVLSSDTSDFNPKIIMLQERSTTFERQEGN